MQKPKTSRSKEAENWYQNIEKKSEALGICFHKARRKLVNMLVKKAFEHEDGNVYCVRCGEIIDSEFHIDHIDAWLFSTNPQEKYFDLSNIGLSHPICNSLSRRNHRTYTQEEAAIRSAVKHRLYQRRGYLKRKNQLHKENPHVKDAKSKKKNS